MNTKIFQNISKIIERDSKSTTYKFALLRGVIDIIQDNSPYIEIHKNKVNIPTGLLIEKWILYYYPILQSKTTIPQINGNSNLAFQKPFDVLIDAYSTRGGFSAFFNDLKNKGIPDDIQGIFFDLVKSLRNTITTMPMKYIGRSISDAFYSIFTYETPSKRSKVCKDLEQLINDFGVFSIPISYYESFKLLGSFLNGQDSILFKWAQFSVNASNQNLEIHSVLNEVLKSPITERNISESKKLYKNILDKQGVVFCVWTGKKLTSYDIDHMIPFSVWKNNDLWNLLPSASRINKTKRDKIPSVSLIENQKELILNYWNTIYKHQTVRFQKEIQVALLGTKSFTDWQNSGIEQLKSSCNYLIENRGFEEWKI